MGPVAPFDASAVALLVGGVGIALLWTENYGESRHQVSLSSQFKMAFVAILSGQCCGWMSVKGVGTLSIWEASLRWLP